MMVTAHFLMDKSSLSKATINTDSTFLFDSFSGEAKGLTEPENRIILPHPPLQGSLKTGRFLLSMLFGGKMTSQSDPVLSSYSFITWDFDNWSDIDQYWY